jgi:7-cyano-7-deazaguanine synthase
LCGIGAIRWLREPIKEVLVDLLLKSELRGFDATGIVSLSKEGTLYERKAHLRASEFIDSTAFHKNFLDKMQVGDTILWNCRAQPVTEVESLGGDTIQPIVSGQGGVILTHNGVVSEDKELTEKYSLKRETAIDSEVIALLYGKLGHRGLKTIESMMTKLAGGFAFIMIDIRKPSRIYLARDFKPLSLHKTKDYIAVASEERFFSVYKKVYGSRVVNIPPYTSCVLNPVTKYEKWVRIYPKRISHLPSENWKKALVLASGGVDSSTAAIVAVKLHKMDVTMVHFDHGQKCEEREWEAVQNIARQIGVSCRRVDLKWLGALGHSPLTDSEIDIPKSERRNVKSTVAWTPGRNLVMLSCLSALAESTGAKYIYTGFTLEESGSYPDNELDFFLTFNEVLKFGTLLRPKLRLVLERLMKPETLLLGHYLGLDYSLTWSCDGPGIYENEKWLPCGECGACHNRRLSFLRAGLEDPQTYAKAIVDLPAWVGDQHRTVSEITMEELVARMKSF